MPDTPNITGQKATATRKRNETRRAASATASNARRTAGSAKTTASRTASATRSNARRTATSAKTTASRSSSGAKGNARRTANTARTTAGSASSATTAETKLRVTQVQQIAERAVLVPVGASLLARDNLVSTVKGLATKYRTRTSVERELKRYERRGASARNRFERQVRRTRTKFERELRQRRRRVEREVRSSVVGSRVEKLVTEAQDRLPSIS
jgi:hypothetical protein